MKDYTDNEFREEIWAHGGVDEMCDDPDDVTTLMGLFSLLIARSIIVRNGDGLWDRGGTNAIELDTYDAYLYRRIEDAVESAKTMLTDDGTGES